MDYLQNDTYNERAIAKRLSHRSDVCSYTSFSFTKIAMDVSDCQ